MSRFIPVLVFGLLTAISEARAAESIAIYSDACIHGESGDLVGVRIAVVRLGDAPYFFVQWAEGEHFGQPEMNKLSPEDLSKGKLNFAIRNGQNPARFSGRITEKAVTGSFDNKGLMRDLGTKVLNLPRVPLSQQTYGSCR